MGALAMNATIDRVVYASNFDKHGRALLKLQIKQNLPDSFDVLTVEECCKVAEELHPVECKDILNKIK
jgi:hypothetical protein|tara:strand:+ start:115 stop:318 length:204 start_codon:yes stop_codon:yes gene_type:complete